MMNTEASVTFSLDQLWLLNDVVRHEGDNSRVWKFPSASLELNEKVAEAILICEESRPGVSAPPSISSYTLELSHGDLLCIDFWVRRGMKSPGGDPIGQKLLLETFKARRSLSGGWEATATEPVMKPEQIEAKIAEWRNQDADSVSDNDTDYRAE